MAEIATQEWFKDLLKKAVDAGYIKGSNSFSLSRLLDIVGIINVYGSLNDALSDSDVARSVFNSHAAVDYLKENYETVKDTILSNPTSAKYLGLSDYAFDILSDGNLDSYTSSDNWELLFPFKVPVMESNTLPEGEVITNREYSSSSGNTYYSRTAFNNYFGPVTTTTKYYGYMPSANDNWFGYGFSSPHKILKAKLVCKEASDRESQRFIQYNVRIDASNDKTNWTHLTEEFTTSGSNIIDAIDIDTGGLYYKYYRLVILSCATSGYTVTNGYGWTLQFYGRKYSALIPNMLNDTYPSGEVSSSSDYDERFLPHQAFREYDKYTTYGWAPGKGLIPAWVQYRFDSPAKAISADVITPQGGSTTAVGIVVDIEASNDGTNWDILVENIEATNKATTYTVELPGDKLYLIYRLVVVSAYDVNNLGGGLKFQLYGPDYSEKKTYALFVTGTAASGNSVGAYLASKPSNENINLDIATGIASRSSAYKTYTVSGGGTILTVNNNDSTLYRSTDFLTFNTSKPIGNGTCGALKHIRDKSFMISYATTTDFKRSVDAGISWTDAGFGNNCSGIVSDGNIIVAGSQNRTKLKYKINNVAVGSWTDCNIDSAEAGINKLLCFNGSKFMCLASNEVDNTVVYTSDDGITWTEVLSTVEMCKSRFFIYGDGKWVTMNRSGELFYSEDDGVSWTKLLNSEIGIGDFTHLSGLAYADDVFYASFIETGHIFTSKDLLSWTKHSVLDKLSYVTGICIVSMN